MSKDAAEILKDALDLPTEARAALIDSLVESLDYAAVDNDAEELWREEIRNRLQEIDNGAVKLIPWEDAERHLSVQLRR